MKKLTFQVDWHKPHEAVIANHTGLPATILLDRMEDLARELVMKADRGQEVSVTITISPLTSAL